MQRGNTVKDAWAPKIGTPELVYENQYFQVSRVGADFGAFTKEYFVLDCGRRTGMLATRNGSLLLVQQYRLLINGLSWEIPGGKVDDGETPEAAAVRECLEETGIRCLNPRPLISYQAGLDVIRNPIHLFSCDEVSENHDPQSIHVQEVAGFDWFPLSRCNQMISNGQILDSFTILAILAYQMLQGKPNEKS